MGVRVGVGAHLTLTLTLTLNTRVNQVGGREGNDTTGCTKRCSEGCSEGCSDTAVKDSASVGDTKLHLGHEQNVRVHKQVDERRRFRSYDSHMIGHMIVSWKRDV